jgi:tRNA(adenine34) deaminase
MNIEKGASDDEKWMAMAIEEAEAAFAEGEVPVGAVAVLGGRFLSRDHNRSVQLRDPTAHAEILALRAAGAEVGNYRLNDLELFVTVEPCAMCAGALIWARVGRLVFGTADEKGGAVRSKMEVLAPGLFNHTVEVAGGVLAEACREILRRFFEERRRRSRELDPRI